MKTQDDEEYVGTDTVPPMPFRVMVTGRDESDALVQRVSARVFHAALIDIIPPAPDTIEAGATTPVTFTVRNLGPAAGLTLTATDGRGNVLDVAPATLQLESGGESTVTVRLAVPADAAPESDTSVLLTASPSGSSSATNYARKQFTVVRRQ
jgi:hypothetical protein